VQTEEHKRNLRIELDTGYKTMYRQFRKQEKEEADSGSL